jgi:NADPH:quinone reductase-like Zn-dependent oxidoreductase
MRQMSQSYRHGDLALVEVPPPTLRPGYVLVRNAASLEGSRLRPSPH